jgi:16S rRNA (adenine1518-N6/adenine1519-N6)-dimethyltransferase
MPDGPAAVPPRQTTAYLKNLFGQVGFTIDARRGQNFLVDLNLLDLVARAAEIGRQDVVLEVGTGTGALTERLAAAAGRVVTAEIDPRLAQLARDRLVGQDNVTIVEGDVLARKHRFAPAFLEAVAEATAAVPGGRLLLVANLPYCVATPVISNLLALPRPFDTAVVTVQREMAERLTAAPGTSSYNALSVWVGAQCRGEILRVLSPTVFWPRPKIDSAIVQLDLEPGRRSLIPDLTRFHHFVRDVFCHRRKLLRGVLLRMAGGKGSPEAHSRVEAALAAITAGPETRAEELSPERFVVLEQAFYAGAASG